MLFMVTKYDVFKITTKPVIRKVKYDKTNPFMLLVLSGAPPDSSSIRWQVSGGGDWLHGQRAALHSNIVSNRNDAVVIVPLQP